MRTDPFRELDRFAQQVFGGPGTWSKPAAMPMDAYRAGDEFVVCFDLPGVTKDAIELDIERIAADYEAGVLTLRIPVAEKAKPRKITVAGREHTDQKVITG